jgi:hypothetical protein
MSSPVVIEVSVERSGESSSGAAPRVKRFRPAPGTDEYVTLGADGVLVHHLSPARGYLHPLLSLQTAHRELRGRRLLEQLPVLVEHARAYLRASTADASGRS